MKWHVDGNALCITTDRFVDLQQSPAYFVDLNSDIARTLLDRGDKLTWEQFEEIYRNLWSQLKRSGLDYCVAWTYPTGPCGRCEYCEIILALGL